MLLFQRPLKLTNYIYIFVTKLKYLKLIFKILWIKFLYLFYFFTFLTQLDSTNEWNFKSTLLRGWWLVLPQEK